MTFDSIFHTFGEMAPITLQSDKDDSISLIEQEPFYITPSFRDLSIQREARIYVISAPGATGKSALAEYLAFKYSSIYWNLARITLGDNSFVGTLVRSVGAENYSKFMANLTSGKAMLIIDAFDEAEMISGAKAVRSFLSEISKSIAHAISPCVILLSRAETAHSICTYFSEIDVSFSHYEISFFERGQSEEFIRQVVYNNKHTTQNEEILVDCIKQYLNNITRLIPGEELSSFIGYAPVLEIIGEHIAQEDNAYKFLSTLKTEKMKGIDVIAKILHNLLVREQEKVQASFLKRMETSYDISTLDVNSIYSASEQLIDVLSFVLFDGYDSSFYSGETVPNEIRDEYIEVISSFLPQHPFIRSSKGGFEFTGPAFRDYVLSLLIAEEDKEAIVQMFFDAKRISNHFPSHLLWSFYTNKEEVVIHSNRISYLFESFRSQSKGDAQAFMSMVGTKESGYCSDWTICSPKGEVYFSDGYDILLCDDYLWLENLYNMYIDVDDLPVFIRNGSQNIQISHSTVLCNELYIIGDRIVFDAYDGSDCMLVSKKDAHIQSASGGTPEITVNGAKLLIAFPNISTYFKLIKYKHDYTEDSAFSIDQFVYILRKILVQFRKHRKDTPAKDAEKIDFVTVGTEPKRRSVFNYLQNRGIIYRDAHDPHLYKISVEKLEQNGISWGAVTRGDNKQLENAYRSFCDHQE